MTWALQRQILYIGIFLLIIFSLGSLIFYPSFKTEPTCSDGVLNGDESGVDCGGSCVRACIFQANPVSILWSRSFMVVPGRYNAVAYLENQNKSLAIYNIKYSFRFADKDNVYIGKREGVATVPPGRSFAVFEPGIDLGSSVPVYTTFSFIESPIWLNVPEDRLSQIKLLTSNINIVNEDSKPHLSVDLKNNSLFSIPDLHVVAILYDLDRNAISASSTSIDTFMHDDLKTLDFTWPLPFTKKVVAKEIIPIYNIFNAEIK